MEESMEGKNLNLAQLIISKSGMSNRPAFYSGRGALLEDFEFTGPVLNIIFDELRQVNRSYAISFIDFVMLFSNLNATDFLIYFYLFAKKGFRLDNMSPNKSGINLESDNDLQRDAIASVTTILSMYNPGRDDTLAIKLRFLGRLPKEFVQMPVIKNYVRNIREQALCHGQR